MAKEYQDNKDVRIDPNFFAASGLTLEEYIFQGIA